MKKLVLFICCLFIFQITQAQYTRQDTLRGSVTEERAWWDLQYYHLKLKIDPENRYLRGSNIIQYQVIEPSCVMQIDLQSPMRITGIHQKGTALEFKQDGNAYFITLKSKQKKGETYSLEVFFEGEPKESTRPPWSGGVTWSRDDNDEHFIATTCQGDGASLWWPCKDHPYDEVDSMLMSINVPAHLTDVSNGQLLSTEQLDDGTKTFNWFVCNPINNYGVNINIAQYEHFSEIYNGEGGPLQCDYYVLPYNLEKAKEQFKQVSKMLEAFEYWFGPYPFYEDGFKLVEVPYLGMEHQSSVTYGNGYQNGYKGRDLSQSGAGLLFDFIIVHESGHEWFANNITARDNADLWIHESFTAYSENLFLDYHYGVDTSAMYVLGTRSNIINKDPIISDYGVNQRGGIDIYYKGANILHTLRQIINDDGLWRQILRGLNKEFRHQTVTALQIQDYIEDQSQLDLASFFDQYLRDPRLPILEYRIYPGGFEYRWTNCLDKFNMVVDVFVDETAMRLSPTTKWQRLEFDNPPRHIKVDQDFYVASIELTH